MNKVCRTLWSLVQTLKCEPLTGRSQLCQNVEQMLHLIFGSCFYLISVQAINTTNSDVSESPCSPVGRTYAGLHIAISVLLLHVPLYSVLGRCTQHFC